MRRIRSHLLATPVFLSVAALAGAQSSVPSENRLQAIVGARIEIGDGHVIEKGNVVVRDGLIISVGQDAPPAGAEILDGKGLIVFPGFIDGYAKKGVKAPDAVSNQDGAAPSSDYASAMMRPANRKGIRPDLQARLYLDLGDDLRKPYLAAGFTTAMFVPSGGYINGAGALVNLSGRPAREAVVVPMAAQSMVLSGAFGSSESAYPGSLLGQIAQVRQALADALWYAGVTGAYNSGGPQRPPSDAVLEALQPLLAHSISAAFEADTAAQIDRATGVSKEFSLKPIIVGGLQASHRIDRLRELEAPVLLSLNFGAEPKGADEKKEDKPDEAKKQDTVDDADTVPDVPERLAEQKRLFLESVHNPQILKEAKILFAFTTNGCKDVPEFMKSLRTAVKNGLPREAALRALTLDAAQIFGMSKRMGSIEVGKIANLSVMTADFLDEKTKVKMLYIDGHKIDPESKQVPPNKPISFGQEGH